jgi:hypothetical protein
VHRGNGKNKSSEGAPREVAPSRIEERHFAPPPSKERVNVGETERLASLVAGGMMAALDRAGSKSLFLEPLAASHFSGILEPRAARGTVPTSPGPHSARPVRSVALPDSSR